MIARGLYQNMWLRDRLYAYVVCRLSSYFFYCNSKHQCGCAKLRLVIQMYPVVTTNQQMSSFLLPVWMYAEI